MSAKRAREKDKRNQYRETSFLTVVVIFFLPSEALTRTDASVRPVEGLELRGWRSEG